MTTQEILTAARAAKAALALADTAQRDRALLGMADALDKPENRAAILEANAADLDAARGHISEVMLDRLALNDKRLDGMAQGIREVAALPDPVGAVLRRIERPNGLVIEKTAVPMGVIAIIYESRPNVTSDAAALALKSGSACVLRCGKEAWRSSKAIVDALRQGVTAAGLPADAVSLIEDTTRASSYALMEAVGYVDLLIPRGGAGLIRACVENAKVPCIQTGTGICHIYVDDTADQDKALDIIENAKASRPSVCNAEEVCLVHKDIAAAFLPRLARRLGPDRAARGLHELREAHARHVHGSSSPEVLLVSLLVRAARQTAAVVRAVRAEAARPAGASASVRRPERGERPAWQLLRHELDLSRPGLALGERRALEASAGAAAARERPRHRHELDGDAPLSAEAPEAQRAEVREERRHEPHPHALVTVRVHSPSSSVTLTS